jgi:hypothetical protein
MADDPFPRLLIRTRFVRCIRGRQEEHEWRADQNQQEPPTQTILW